MHHLRAVILTLVISPTLLSTIQWAATHLVSIDKINFVQKQNKEQHNSLIKHQQYNFHFNQTQNLNKQRKTLQTMFLVIQTQVSQIMNIITIITLTITISLAP